MDKYVQSFQEFFGPLSNAQRAMFIGLLVVVISIIGAVFYWAQKEDQTLLFGSLQPEAAQEIVAELKKKGVNYKLDEGGQAIYVSSDKVHELRLDLAQLGSSYSDVKGYELFDQNALGMTDFMQQVNKKRALEGELARSINSLDQVEFSRIHLVLPERSPFEDAKVEASASVILNLKKGKQLTQDQIAGITALIGGSVEDLDPANVTVLDQAGNRLTDDMDDQSEFTFGANQMQLRQKTEAYLTDRGQTMLDRVLGAGNSIVRVSVEHDFDRVVRESDIIDPESRTIISEEKREQTNNDQVMEPVPIDLSVPSNQRESSVVVSSNDNSSGTQTRNYEVTRTKEVFEKTQGEIKHMSASVLLNYKKVTNKAENGETTITYEPYSDAEVQKFKEVVQLALGIQEDRGDELSIKQIEFFDRTYDMDANYFTNQPTFKQDILRWSLIAITFGLVLFLINSIRKRAGTEDLNTVSNFMADDQLEESPEQQAIAGSTNDELPEGEEGQAALPENAGSTGNIKSYSKEEIVDFVELKPAEAAQMVRALLAED
jgi:flagellar M-ring protein FliF